MSTTKGNNRTAPPGAPMVVANAIDVDQCLPDNASRNFPSDHDRTSSTHGEASDGVADHPTGVSQEEASTERWSTPKNFLTAPSPFNTHSRGAVRGFGEGSATQPSPKSFMQSTTKGKYRTALPGPPMEVANSIGVDLRLPDKPIPTLPLDREPTSCPHGEDRDGMANHPGVVREEAHNSKNIPFQSSGPESKHQILRTAVRQPKQRNKSFWKKLFCCCFPFCCKSGTPEEVYVPSSKEVKEPNLILELNSGTQTDSRDDKTVDSKEVKNEFEESFIDSDVRLTVDYMVSVVECLAPTETQTQIKTDTSEEKVNNGSEILFDRNQLLEDRILVQKQESDNDFVEPYLEKQVCYEDKPQTEPKSDCSNQQMVEQQNVLISAQPSAGDDDNPLINVRTEENFTPEDPEKKIPLDYSSIKSVRNRFEENLTSQQTEVRLNGITEEPLKQVDSSDEQNLCVATDNKCVAEVPLEELKVMEKVMELMPKLMNFDIKDSTHRIEAEDNEEKKEFESVAKDKTQELIERLSQMIKVSQMVQNLENTKVGPQMRENIVSCAPTLISNHIVLGKYLGGGSYGVVLSARMGDQEIAVKFDQQMSSRAHSLRVKRIIKTMSQLKHPNVVQVFDLKDNNYKVMAMECGSRDLYDWMRLKASQYQLLSLSSIHTFTNDIISGVAYIHSKGLAHHDLKLVNIVMCKVPPNNICAKIADFDLIKNCFDTTGTVLKQMRCVGGTPGFKAPEALESVVIDDIRKPDVWSIGVIVYLMLTNHFPYPRFGVNDPNIQSIRNSFYGLFSKMPNIPHNSPAIEEIIRVMRKLLEPDYKKRESLESILKDKYFDSNRQKPSEELRFFAEKAELSLFR